MTKAEIFKAKYGEDYYSKIAKQVKNRQGFHTRGNAKEAQIKSTKAKNAKVSQSKS